MSRPLGKTQQSVLESVRERRGWSEGCGWVWGNYSTTVRVLEALVRRGLVVKTEETSRHGHKYTRYAPVK